MFLVFFFFLLSCNIFKPFLQFIPDAISKLKKLEELDVSSNSLESLPDSIGFLLNLRILNVTANNLTTLPESIAHCRFRFLSFLVNFSIVSSFVLTFQRFFFFVSFP